MTNLETSGVSPLEGAPKREPLTDAKMGNLLAAVGNSSMKAILLSCMAERPYHVFTETDMIRAVHMLQGISGGQGDGWVISHRALGSYCSDSFEPIGIVAKQIRKARTGEAFGYQITETGKEEGFALSGYLIDFAKRRNTSLYRFLGNTNSSTKPTTPGTEEEAEFKKRSPMTRINIFRGLLAQGGPVTQTKLAEFIGESSDSLVMHLQSLGTNNVISYKVLGSGQKIEAVGGQVFNKNSRTQISLTEEQRETLSHLVSIIDEVQGMDAESILKGKRLAVSVLSSPGDVAEIAKKEKEASKRANRLQTEVVKGAVREYVLLNKDQGVDIKTMGEFISETFGSTIGRQRVWQILQEMREDKTLKGEKRKGIVVWYLYKRQE